MFIRKWLWNEIVKQDRGTLKSKSNGYLFRREGSYFLSSVRESHAAFVKFTVKWKLNEMEANVS